MGGNTLAENLRYHKIVIQSFNKVSLKKAQQNQR